MITKSSKIYIAGHKGMVGSAINRKLQSLNYTNIIFRSRKELDLLNKDDVNNFLKEENPEYIFIAAAKVGGIKANSNNQAEFLYENLTIQNNIIHSAYRQNINKLMFLGSSCIYPKNAPQPLKEDYLLTSPLEETNEGYAIAKIAGIKLCEYYNKQYKKKYVAAMPTNLYGPNDNYDLETSHVLPALINKIHFAKKNNLKKIDVWGTGNPKREFLYVDDLADACVFIMEHDISDGLYNIGTQKDITIRELVDLISSIIGFNGYINFDKSMPDGMMRKILDVSKINNLGWSYKTNLMEGIKLTYKNYLKNN